MSSPTTPAGARRTSRRAAASVALSACALLALGAAAPAEGARTLYVADAGATGTGTIAQLAIAPSGALTPLATPFAASGGEPQHIAISSDGRFAYATAAEPGLVNAYAVGEDGALSPLATPAVPAGIGAHGVSITPDGRFLYVGNQEPGTVTQYAIGSDGVPVPLDPPSVPSGAGASGVAISPDGRSVYVTNLFARSVSQYDVDPDSGRLAPKAPATVRMPLAPSGLAVAPDGRSLYVATLTGRLAQFDIDPDDGTLTPKRPANVRVGLGAAGVAISPDGRHLYTPNGLADSASQFAIDRRTGRLSPLRPPSVPAGEKAGGAAITPNGRALYTTAAAADAVTWLTVGPNGRLAGGGRQPAAGAAPHGVTVSPNQGPTARLRVDGGARAGHPVRFDASASSDPDGQVRRYRWHFGDGHVHEGRRARVHHRYAAPGRYTVRLVVIDDEGCSHRLVYTGQSALCNGGPQAVATRRIHVRRGG